MVKIDKLQQYCLLRRQGIISKDGQDYRATANILKQLIEVSIEKYKSKCRQFYVHDYSKYVKYEFIVAHDYESQRWIIKYHSNTHRGITEGDKFNCVLNLPYNNEELQVINNLINDPRITVSAENHLTIKIEYYPISNQDGTSKEVVV